MVGSIGILDNLDHRSATWTKIGAESILDVLRWEDNSLLLLDQTRLPHEVEYLACRHYRQVCEAIARLQVRGAPAIGIAAAFGYLLAAVNYEPGGQDLERHMEQAARELRETRPTAVNLAWALERMTEMFQPVKGAGLGRVKGGPVGGGAADAGCPEGPGPPDGGFWEPGHPGAGAPADLLQHRRPGDSGIRHRPGGDLDLPTGLARRFTSTCRKPVPCCRAPA